MERFEKRLKLTFGFSNNTKNKGGNVDKPKLRQNKLEKSLI
jgi:hypothetical protein